MQQYISTLRKVYVLGEPRPDRTGVGVMSLFSPEEMVFFLGSNEFPLVTTKKVFWRGVVEELLWMLSGSTNNNDLKDKGVTIWNEWAAEDGDLGPIYGKQWRNWCGKDQISNLIQGIKDDPFGRRHIVSAWNVSELDRMALAPCHCFFQVHIHGTADPKDPTGQTVTPTGLSLKLYQRSADMFLGVPFNIASYALLTHMLAAQTGLQPVEFIHTLGDAHIYKNHLDQVLEQMDRDPKPLPSIKLNPDVKSIFDYKFEDIELIGYDPHPTIKGDVAV